MQKYNRLQDLPLEIRETNKPTVYPQTMALEILEKLQDRDYALAHCDLSLDTAGNVKRILTILSNNRIQFN